MIALPSPEDQFQYRLFDITTPARPQQLYATYVGTRAHQAQGFSIAIDPVGVNRMGPIIDHHELGDLQVSIAMAGQAGYERFYWEWNGWWYTLEAPSATTADLSYDYSIIGSMTEP